ncbi:MAG: thioredoxin family protein [Ignavibacteriae bacterium]|nr:thioredoxin family protein [Ignavibacteriota bacterium]
MIRRLALVLALCALPFAGSLRAQDEPEEKVLVGPLTLDQLLDLRGWFGTEFIRYTPSQAELDQLPAQMKDVTIVCVLGTWCEDSRREVPRMVRILQSMRDFDPARFVLIGTTKDKKSPGGEHALYNIEKVPTFIIQRKGEEIGRIVEAPVGMLERDLLGILLGVDMNAPAPNSLIIDNPPPPVVAPAPHVISPDGAKPDTAKPGADGTVQPPQPK